MSNQELSNVSGQPGEGPDPLENEQELQPGDEGYQEFTGEDDEGGYVDAYGNPTDQYGNPLETQSLDQQPVQSRRAAAPVAVAPVAPVPTQPLAQQPVAQAPTFTPPPFPDYPAEPEWTDTEQAQYDGLCTEGRFFEANQIMARKQRAYEQQIRQVEQQRSYYLDTVHSHWEGTVRAYLRENPDLAEYRDDLLSVGRNPNVDKRLLLNPGAVEQAAQMIWARENWTKRKQPTGQQQRQPAQQPRREDGTFASSAPRPAPRRIIDPAERGGGGYSPTAGGPTAAPPARQPTGVRRNGTPDEALARRLGVRLEDIPEELR